MKFTLEHFLSGEGAAGKVLAHAQQLRTLEARFAAILPAPLRQAARVANYKAGTLVVLTDNGAVASKLRQMSQRLCAEMSKGAAQCSAMEIRVQPVQLPTQSTGCTQKPLSAATCERLSATAQQLPDGPLRQALDRLVARAARQG